MLPYLRDSKPWFGFLVHLRGIHDADRVGVGRFIRAYSDGQSDCERKLESLPAVVSSEVRFRSTAACGEVICINRLPERMTGPAARQDVIKAAHLAASRGARVVGLGALTAPATGGGLTILDEVPREVTLTNGNALTAAIVGQNVSEAAQYLSGSDGRKAVVAIIGCTGSVGSATTQRLAGDGFELLLIGRNQMRVERRFSDLQRATFSGQVADIKHADVVVVLTNDPAALVTPDMPAPNSIVIDCSQPANIPRDRYPEFAQLGIAVVEGGLVRIPEYSSTDDMGFSDRTVTFACLAETYLLARSGSREHSVGRCTAEKAAKMEQLAARFGVEACRLDIPLQKFAHAS